MSKCALAAAAFFLADIGADPVSAIHVAEHTVSAVDVYNANKPPNTLVDVATTLENCTKDSVKTTLIDNVITIAILLGAVILVMLLTIIGLSTALRERMVFIFIVLLIVVIISFFVIYSSLTIKDIDVGPCVTNATRNVDVYEQRLNVAIQSGLCGY